MTPDQNITAERCLRAAEQGALDFPAIVGSLMEGGFDGYATDLRLGETRYYLPDGSSAAFAHGDDAGAVAEQFDVERLRAAIRDAQTKAPGYSYPWFLERIAAAGCAGYLVSFPGRRVLYYGRTGETHVEHFPNADRP